MDEVKFYSSANTEEPDQNDDSVTSLWVGYKPGDDYWEIGFADMTFNRQYSDSSWSTFEIKWSKQPITNENWGNATPVNAQFYSGAAHTSNPSPGAIRRPTSWKRMAYTRFTLPAEATEDTGILYFAVKDVSTQGSGGGTQWPYNTPDGRNPPNPFIKMTYYHIDPTQVVLPPVVIPPNPPSNLSISID